MEEIEITTTQNITIHYELASVFERIVSLILDLVILTIASLVIYALTNAIFSDSSGLLVYVIILPIIVLYSLFFELFNNGQSPGKMSLKLRVIRMDGEKANFSNYLMRWVFRSLDIYGSFGGIAFLSVISSSNNQRTGDLLANTVVVSLKKDNRIQLDNLLKLNNEVKYVPVYKDVVRLDEDTMLLVKEVLKKNIQYPNKAHSNAFELLVKKIATELNLKVPKNKVEFLRTLLKDYIFLTR